MVNPTYSGPHKATTNSIESSARKTRILKIKGTKKVQGNNKTLRCGHNVISYEMLARQRLARQSSKDLVYMFICYKVIVAHKTTANSIERPARKTRIYFLKGTKMQGTAVLYNNSEAATTNNMATLRTRLIHPYPCYMCDHTDIHDSSSSCALDS